MRRNSKNILNLDKNRNANNMNRLNYNCGGFALGFYSWLYLDNFYHTEIDDYDYEEKIDFKELAEQMESECVIEIINIGKGLIREIYSENELRKNEFLVLFRIAYDDNCIDDFHFLKRLKNGQWVHKMGENNIENVNFNPYNNWTFLTRIYNGSIKYLAINNKLY